MILKAKGVIWCGFEGLKPRNDGEVVTKGGGSFEWVSVQSCRERTNSKIRRGRGGSWCRSAVSRTSILSKRESIEKHDDLQRSLSRINTSNSGLRSGCLTGRAEKQTGHKHKTVFPRQTTREDARKKQQMIRKQNSKRRELEGRLPLPSNDVAVAKDSI